VSGGLSVTTFRRQAPLGPFIADFACLDARLVVELDGGQHADQVVEDSQRTAYLAEHGFRVLRFWNNQVFTELDDVLEAIWLALTSPQPSVFPTEELGQHAVGIIPSPHPNPPLRGEGDRTSPYERQT
jgi:very-short-patch-repair endonuclease